MLALFVKIPTMYNVYDKSAVFPRIPYTLRITFRYSVCHISSSHALHNPPQPYWSITVINKIVKPDNEKACGTCMRNIRAQAYNLRKIYMNLENHREYPHKPYIARI